MEPCHADKGEEDADSPHRHKREDQRRLHIPDAVECPLEDNEHRVKRLGDRDDPEHGGAHRDHVRVFGKDLHEKGRKQKQKQPEEPHQQRCDQHDRGGKLHQLLLVLRSVIVSGKRGGGSLHAVPRHVERRFRGQRDRMRRDRDRAEPCDQRGEYDLPEHGDHSFPCDRHAYPEAFPHDLPVVFQVQFREKIALSEGGKHQDPARRISGGGSHRGAGHAPSRSPDGHRKRSDTDRPDRVDQKIVQHDIDHIHQDVDPHRRSCVSRCPECGGKNDARHPEEHRNAADPEIERRIPPDLRRRAEPVRKMRTDQKGHRRHDGSENENQKQRLVRRARCALPVPGTERLRDACHDPGPDRPDGRIDQPRGRGGQPDRRRRRCAEQSDLRGIHILHDGLQRRFRHGRPGETENGPPGFRVFQCLNGIRDHGFTFGFFIISREGTV